VEITAIMKRNVSIHFEPKGQITHPPLSLPGQVVTENVILDGHWPAR
jgi:hypothetical protein